MAANAVDRYLVYHYGNIRNAGTALDVDIKSCDRVSKVTVVCHFTLQSDSSESMSLTAGTYSQGVAKSGKAFDSSKVQVGDVSGLAIHFEVLEGVVYSGELHIENVNDQLSEFSLVTIRFKDGVWQTQDIPISNFNKNHHRKCTKNQG